MIEIETPRLLLRRWKPEDVPALARIYADPEVIRYMAAMTPETTGRQVRRFMRGWEQDGFSLCAAVYRSTGRLIGRIGLIRHRDWPEKDSPVEVGWLLDRRFWGRGLATEGGRASLRYGFERLGLERIISIASPENITSRRVMQKCGLEYGGATRWRGHDVVWYAIDRSTWEASRPE